MCKFHLFPRFARLSVLLLPGVAAAYQPLITDDTGTQGVAGHQLEFSLDGARARQAGNDERVRGANLVYTYGVTESLDLFAGVSYVDVRRDARASAAHGFGSPMIGAKWRLYENEVTGTSLALKPELRLPVSTQDEAKGLGVGKLSAQVTAIVTQQLSFGALHVNAVAGRERSRDSATMPETSYRRLSVAPAWHLNDSWKLVADFGQEWLRAGDTTRISRYVEAGVVYAVATNVELALGLIGTRDNDRPARRTRAATLGLTLHL